MADRTSIGRAERIERSLQWLERYAPLLYDAAAFRAALDEPVPVDLLVLPGRITPDALAAGLVRRGLAVRRFPGAPYHVRVSGHEGAGRLPEVLLGFAYPQGVSSAFGPQALAPRPGERLLDMCAAPGGKTILLDALAGGRAPILAGEPSGGRTGILVQTLARSGALGAIVVQQDGKGFPAVGPFDAILLDAPCTGEGTFRVPSPRYDLREEQGLEDAPRLQKRLLARALDILSPGGRLVYSTCAYSPEENEAVLDAVLAERDDVTIAELPADVPGLPGVPEWRGTRFTAPVTRGRRMFPHHLGSWGFFVCLLHKDPASTRTARLRTKGPSADGTPPAPPFVVATEDEAWRNVAEFLHESFGVAKDTWDDVALVHRGRDDFGLLRAADAWELGRLRLVVPGMRLVHRAGRGLQPTNAALRWLGARVREHVVDVTLDQAAVALETGSVALDGVRDDPQVAVRVDGIVAAKGHVRGGALSLEIPAGWR